MDNNGSINLLSADDIEEQWQKALNLHELGNFGDAATIYQKLLNLLPLDGTILNSYGTLLYQQQYIILGCHYIRKSIIADPGIAVFYNRMGVVEKAGGDALKAARAFKRALMIESEYEPNLNLCELFLEQGQPDDALEPAQKAVAIAPENWLARLRLAAASRLTGRNSEAISEAEEAASLNPLSHHCYQELSLANMAGEKGSMAFNAISKSILLAPDNLSSYFNLLGSLNIWAEAEDKQPQLEIDFQKQIQRVLDRINVPFWGRCAIISDRSNPLIWFWHGVNCGRANLLDHGLSGIKRSILIDPGQGNRYQALSILFQRSGVLHAAYFFARVTMQVFDDLGFTPHILWETCFALGQEKRGWKHWSDRFEYDGAVDRRGLPAKRWQQEKKINGKLLVCSEQGIGDEILYLSCLPDLLRKHKAVIIECDERWVPIFRRSFPEIIVIPRQVKFDPGGGVYYDYTQVTRKYNLESYVLCGDLPKFFRADLKTQVSAGIGLKANPKRKEFFKRYLRKEPGQTIIGVCWRSGFAPNWPSVYPKLEDLLAFMPKEKGIRLVSLQYGVDDEELAKEHGNSIKLETIKDLDQVNDLEGVAALISSLDLVISASTTVLHLSCALGVTTISTYYPNFRSSRGGDPLFMNCYPMLAGNEIFSSEKVAERTGKTVQNFIREEKICPLH